MHPLLESQPHTEKSNTAATGRIPVSVLIPTRNEALNLRACLAALGAFGEVIIVDSQSTDETLQIAAEFGATVVQFHYRGGWPKKRQWVIDTFGFRDEWVFLVDADEVVTPQLEAEIRSAIQDECFAGYHVSLQHYFLGRALRHGGNKFAKLSLFRLGRGGYECRLKDQDATMADMEVHEHVVVNGSTRKLRNALIHHNVNSLARYIEKHNEYSNWEASVLLAPHPPGVLPPSLFGNQAQRRRWLKRKLYRVPGTPVLMFLYKYFLRLGFLDGVPGLIYCGYQAIQLFHTKSKVYELRLRG